jgi:hypothetical protein
VLGFAFCRYVLELPAVVAMDREAVVASLGPTLQRYLTEACLRGGFQNSRARRPATRNMQAVSSRD